MGREEVEKVLSKKKGWINSKLISKLTGLARTTTNKTLKSVRKNPDFFDVEFEKRKRGEYWFKKKKKKSNS